ncbi:hypothetical protein D9M68_991570 [compost metagenome]
MADWIDMSPATAPPEGEVVMTRDSGGQEQALKRVGNLLFFPDMSMYVYYVPRAWRRLTIKEKAQEIAKLQAIADQQASSIQRAIDAMSTAPEKP